MAPKVAVIAGYMCSSGLLMAALAQGVQQPTGTVVAIVRTADSSEPLSFSTVSAIETGREDFTSMTGLLALRALPAGPIRLRIRHIGYTPVVLPIVVHAGAIDTVRVSLTRLAVKLAAAEIRSDETCRKPGAPKNDAVFAAVFDQIRQNAEQYRLLATRYPFRYGLERTTSATFGRDVTKPEGVDTMEIPGIDDWRYVPGSVVHQRRFLFIPIGTPTMRIPTLVNFADTTFIQNHCFFNAGVERLNTGAEVLRVDFLAADRIREPDVEGSIFLDPSTFQIRRSLLRLTHAGNAAKGITGVEVVTDFVEVLPAVSVIGGVSAVTRLERDRRLLNPATATSERQRMIGFEFVGRRPGDPERPAASEVSAERR